MGFSLLHYCSWNFTGYLQQIRRSKRYWVSLSISGRLINFSSCMALLSENTYLIRTPDCRLDLPCFSGTKPAKHIDFPIYFGWFYTPPLHFINHIDGRCKYRFSSSLTDCDQGLLAWGCFNSSGLEWNKLTSGEGISQTASPNVNCATH